MAAYRRAEEDIKNALGAKVIIKPGKKKGKIEIEYYSPDELERLLTVFKQIPSQQTFV
jgi:ParB family chromosome partitioning protein